MLFKRGWKPERGSWGSFRTLAVFVIKVKLTSAFAIFPKVFFEVVGSDAKSSTATLWQNVEKETPRDKIGLL